MLSKGKISALKVNCALGVAAFVLVVSIVTIEGGLTFRTPTLSLLLTVRLKVYGPYTSALNDGVAVVAELRVAALPAGLERIAQLKAFAGENRLALPLRFVRHSGAPVYGMPASATEGSGGLYSCITLGTLSALIMISTHTHRYIQNAFQQ